MTLFEAIVVVAALVVVGAASILTGSPVDPVLAGLAGTAIGYGAKGALGQVSSSPTSSPRPADWKGSDA